MTSHQEVKRNSSCLEKAFRGKEEEFLVLGVERELSMKLILLKILHAQTTQNNSYSLKKIDYDFVEVFMTDIRGWLKL